MRQPLTCSSQNGLNKVSDTVGQPPSKFEQYFFLCQFPQRFCLQRRHVGHTQFDTLGFANSIPRFCETEVGEAITGVPQGYNPRYIAVGALFVAAQRLPSSAWKPIGGGMV